MNKNLLPLNLQFFADGNPAGTEANADDVTETNTEEATDTFTQEDVDRLVAERAKREETKSAKTIKELQKELDAYKNANQAEEEHHSEDEESLKARVAEKENEVSKLSLQVEALKSGVSSEKLEKFVKLASLSESEDLAERVKETLEEFPEFGTPQADEKTKKKQIVNPGNPNGSGDKTDAFAEAANKYK